VVSAIAELLVKGNWGRWISWQCQNFRWKLQSSSLCACTVQTWPKNNQNDWCNVQWLQIAMHSQLPHFI